MKHLFLLFAALILLASCSKELSRNEAFKLLQKEYPKELFYQVFTADPDHAQRIEQAGMVTAGLVTIDTKAPLLEPIIYFTDKANNLVLPTPANEKARKIQRVKTGEYHLVEITGIEGDDKKAAVEYTIEVRNITPFATLYKKPLIDKEQTEKTVYFIKYDDGWRIDRNDGLEYLFE